ncbi:MAG TPA: hypothetical protein VHX17_02650 [Candidatus Cybelea sp.]|nr:hypothetical protein [Candidatus Cybelea sp.]
MALLAGCSGAGGSQSSTPATGMNPAAVGGHAPGAAGHKGTFTSVKMPKVHSDKGKSHVSPDAGNAPRLLFISDDGTNDVYMFKMPSMTLKGTLTGFSEPQGMCADKAGNIWITNTGTLQIYQYSRTGTLLNTLSDPDGDPVGCAIDKSTGDLAVTNIFDNSGNATVDVYANATGTPTSYSNPAQSENFFPSYDNSGNLYVDGFGNSGFSLSVLPSGSSSMTTVSVSGGTIFFPGGMNYKGGSLIIGDQECNGGSDSCQYATTVSGSTATITGSTPLENSDGGACDVDQGTIAPQGKYFAGGCITEGSGASTAARWAYPAGGIPTNFSTNVSEPIGAAISAK